MVVLDKLKNSFKEDLEVLNSEKDLSVIRINKKKLIKKLAWQIKEEFDILYSLAVVDYYQISSLTISFQIIRMQIY